MTLDLPIPNNSNKQPSQELEKLLEELKDNFSSTKNIFERAVNKAKEEGFTDKEIDSLLYSKLKEVIPRKTLFRYRQEFIPLAIDKRNNNSSDDDDDNNNEMLVSNDTTTNEIKFTSKDVTAEVMEKLRLDSIMRRQRWDDEIRRNKILEQLPKEVVEYANKDGELSTNKLEMLLTKNIKQYPELQKTLIDKIKDTKRIKEEVKISDNKAREIVEQTNRDIETGAIQKVGKTYMRYDELSEKLDDQIVKTPNQRYLDIIKSVHKLCESLTGKKLDTSNWKYTEDHFKYTKEYRQEILRGNRDKRSLIALNNQLVLIADYADDFIKMIDESLKDMDNKPDLTE